MQGGCKRNVLKQFESIRKLAQEPGSKILCADLDISTAPILS